MKLNFKSVLSVILCGIMLFSVMAFSVSAADEKDIKFNSDGKFTILNFSDIQDGFPLRPITKQYLKDTLELVKPDMIVLTGDNISGGRTKTVTLSKLAIKEFMDIFEDYGAPVAAVFGNHDDDNDCLATKEIQMAYYCTYDCFVGKDEGSEISNCGTYNLPVYSHDGENIVFNLWFTDSGNYNDENDLGGYGCTHKDQIEWYKKTSAALAEQNGGEPVPSINFQHIVVPEIWDALDKDENGNWILPEGAKGDLDETPCPPNYSNGQFDAFLEMGDVLATVSGHDHVNNYEIDYKGIKIINTPGVGFRSYNNENVGSRVFILDENNPEEFETYCVEYNDVYSEDDEVAQYRYLYCSDTTETADQITYFFKYVIAWIKSLFSF